MTHLPSVAWNSETVVPKAPDVKKCEGWLRIIYLSAHCGVGKMGSLTTYQHEPDHREILSTLSSGESLESLICRGPPHADLHYHYESNFMLLLHLIIEF
jgi:hypothetical protein